MNKGQLSVNTLVSRYHGKLISLTWLLLKIIMLMSVDIYDFLMTCENIVPLSKKVFQKQNEETKQSSELSIGHPHIKKRNVDNLKLKSFETVCLLRSRKRIYKFREVGNLLHIYICNK